MSSNQSWRVKFAKAFAGTAHAMRNQVSFHVHVPAAVIVLALAGWLRLDAWRWAVLLVAITMVISAELLNSALEDLVAVVHPEHSPRIGHALDAAAGAVLVASIGAAAIGLVVLGPPLWQQLF